jgi:hypothetical protein
VAPDPSVERVARVDHSMVGGTGSHMVLWAPPWDSTARLSGYSLHDLAWEFHSGVHHVALEAVSKIKSSGRD